MDHLGMWRLKRRIEHLESVRPVGHTSIVTVLVRPDDHMCRIRSFITEEHSKANNIKSAQNRGSVQDGLRSIGEYLKMYKIPPVNGIACYFGSAVNDPYSDKEKRLKMYFEPPRPIGRFVYHCDVRVQTEPLRELLRDQESYGFIVMDGKGAMFAVVRGNEKHIKCRFTVDLPRKHSRGGQSAMRFARLREEMRKNYITQVCAKASTVFIADEKPNVCGLVLAGQAQFKDELEKSPHLDNRLKAIVQLTVTVAYGDYHGLDEAIRLSTEILDNLRLTAEIKLLSEFMKLLQKGRDDLVAYGVKSSVQALEEGAVAKLIVYEDLETVRFLLKDINSGRETTIYLPPNQQPSLSDHDVIENQPLIEWLADNVIEFGSKLELVTDKSQEGAMLKLGFDGIAAILRYSRAPEQDNNFDDLTNLSSLNIDLDEY